MAIYNYAVLENGVITNVVAIDDEAVGFDNAELGKWEPWGHDRAKAEGMVLLHAQLPTIGWTTSDNVTFVHPDNPNQTFTAPDPMSDRPDFVQPTA